jgi:hypothetical protein
MTYQIVLNQRNNKMNFFIRNSEEWDTDPEHNSIIDEKIQTLEEAQKILASYTKNKKG